MVRPGSPWSRARPKSVTQRLPRASISRLAGLMSRWTTPSAVGVLERLGRLDAQLGRRAGRMPASGPTRRTGGASRRRERCRGAPSIPPPARRPPPEAGPDSAPAASGPLQLADHFRQRPALDELHGVVVDAPLAADGVDRHDVRVVQAGRRQGLVRNRWSCRGSSAAANGRTFSATRRPSETCSAS